MLFPGFGKKTTDLPPLADALCSRWKSMCVVAFLGLHIVCETIVSKLTYVWARLDLQQMQLPANVVLLEAPPIKSSWVELQSDSLLAGRLAGRLAA